MDLGRTKEAIQKRKAGQIGLKERKVWGTKFGNKERAGGHCINCTSLGNLAIAGCTLIVLEDCCAASCGSGVVGKTLILAAWPKEETLSARWPPAHHEHRLRVVWVWDESFENGQWRGRLASEMTLEDLV